MKQPKIYRGGAKPNLSRDWYVEYCDSKGKRKLHKKGINKYHTIAEREQAAKTILAAIKAKIEARQLPGAVPYLTIKEAIDWAFEYRAKRWRPITKELMGYNRDLFLQCVDPTKDVTKLTRVQGREIIEKMSYGRGLGDSAYHRYKAVIKGFFETLLDWEKVSMNPFHFDTRIRRPKPVERKRLTKEEFQTVKEHLAEYAPDFLNYWIFFFFTTIRPSEIFHIKIEDIKMKERKINVYKSGLKDKEDRQVQIPDNLIKWLNKMKLQSYPGHYFLFGRDFKPQEQQSPIKRHYGTYAWKKWVKDDLGIDADLYATKHLAIDILEGLNPGAGTQQAGHSSSYVTSRHYKARESEINNQAIKKMPEF